MLPKVAEVDVTVLTTALDNVDVEVPERIVAPIKFTAVPEVKIEVEMPASNASAQPSPSESKSNLLGTPSASVSKSKEPHNALNSPKNIL